MRKSNTSHRKTLRLVCAETIPPGRTSAAPEQLGKAQPGRKLKAAEHTPEKKFPRHPMEASEGHCSSAEPNLNSGHQWEQSTMISDTLKPSLQPELPSN